MLRPDPNSRQFTRTLPGGSTTNQTTSYFYDAQNRLTQTVGPDGFTNTVVFDVAGRQSLTIDQLGHTNRYDYDAQGRLSKLTYPDGFYDLYMYDAEGRRTNTVERASRETRTGYDALGRVTSVTNAWNTTDQAVTRTIFDAAGREARALASNLQLSPGTHPFAWDGADDAGMALRSGLYFVRVNAGARSFTLKLTMLR